MGRRHQGRGLALVSQQYATDWARSLISFNGDTDETPLQSDLIAVQKPCDHWGCVVVLIAFSDISRLHLLHLLLRRERRRCPRARGLPAVVTITLALGAQRIWKESRIRKLPAENLGSAL